MPSTGLTSIQAPWEPAADLLAPCSPSQHVVPEDGAVGFETLADPEASGREARIQPPAHRGWGRGAVDATARWLRRALAESARAWALAAGVPPDLYP